MNPVLPDDPWLRAALADGAPRDQMIDYLQDRDCTLGNVLALFAGTPPDWRHVLGLATLVRWLEATGVTDPDPALLAMMRPDDPPAPQGVWRDEGGRRVPQGQCDGAVFAGCMEREERFGWPSLGPRHFAVGCPRCEKAGGVLPVVRVFPVPRSQTPDTNRGYFSGRCPKCRAAVWCVDDLTPEILAFKRVVLGLFPGVPCPAFVRSDRARLRGQIAKAAEKTRRLLERGVAEGVQLPPDFLGGGAPHASGADRTEGSAGDWEAYQIVPAPELIDWHQARAGA